MHSEAGEVGCSHRGILAAADLKRERDLQWDFLAGYDTSTYLTQSKSQTHQGHKIFVKSFIISYSIMQIKHLLL